MKQKTKDQGGRPEGSCAKNPKAGTAAARIVRAFKRKPRTPRELANDLSAAGETVSRQSAQYSLKRWVPDWKAKIARSAK